MSITDLIPWKRKKKTKVPVKVTKQTKPAVEREMNGRPDAFTRWFGLAPFGAFGGSSDFFGPRMDLVEYDDAYKVTFEVPGLEKEDLAVTLSGDRLTVRGKNLVEEEHRGRTTRWVRQSQRAFRRSVLMPSKVDPKGVEASLRRGVLSIRLPKVAGGSITRRISVRGT